MADKQSFGMVDTFPCASGAALPARRCVTMDTTARGNVKLPAGTPEKTCAGITVEKQQGVSTAIAVQIDGVATVESDGSAVINPGDYVIPVGTTGQVKTQVVAAGSAAVYDVIGMCVSKRQVPATAGELVSVLLGKRPTVGA